MRVGGFFCFLVLFFVPLDSLREPLVFFLYIYGGFLGFFFYMCVCIYIYIYIYIYKEVKNSIMCIIECGVGWVA